MINKEMVYSTFRHFLTLISTAILMKNVSSIDTAIPELVQKLFSGDVASITSSVMIVFSLLWSYWAKASEETKNVVVKKLSLK